MKNKKNKNEKNKKNKKLFFFTILSFFIVRIFHQSITLRSRKACIFDYRTSP